VIVWVVCCDYVVVFFVCFVFVSVDLLTCRLFELFVFVWHNSVVFICLICVVLFLFYC